MRSASILVGTGFLGCFLGTVVVWYGGVVWWRLSHDEGGARAFGLDENEYESLHPTPPSTLSVSIDFRCHRLMRETEVEEREMTVSLRRERVTTVGVAAVRRSVSPLLRPSLWCVLPSVWCVLL